jgi:hypothetical protein
MRMEASMRRRNAGHIIRIIAGSLACIFGVLALSLLVLAIFAGISKTEISAGLGTFDVGIAPTDFQNTARRLHVGQPFITEGPDPFTTAVCYQGKIHEAAFLAVSFYVQTCDIWANQPRPGAVPTTPAKVYPSPVYTGVPAITVP